VSRIPGPKQQLNHIDKRLIFKRNFVTDGSRQTAPDNCGQSQQTRNLSISDAFFDFARTEARCARRKSDPIASPAAEIAA
jgi:hypothetical protein